jgi:hypothetical protein
MELAEGKAAGLRNGAGSASAVSATQWRGFLRALAEEIDETAGVAARDTMLRSVGKRMAALLPLPQAVSFGALEMEMNELLGAIGWGGVRLTLLESERTLVLEHHCLPRIGAAGDPPGTWLAAVLEGLYAAWMEQQPGSDASLVARRQPGGGETIVLRYGRS